MKIELSCPACACHFGAPPQTPAEDILDRMTDDGPWFGLADGDTFEDMVLRVLMARGRIRCPECGSAVTVTGTRVGWLAWRRPFPNGPRGRHGGRVPQPA
jgi:hypothetical protein